MAQTLISRAKKIRLIGLDVDGVLTRGDVIVLESGEEVKLWNAKDRCALAIIRDFKVPILVAWITGRKSNTVARAAADLKIHHLVQGSHDKKSAMMEILKKHRLSPDQAAFVGDDLIDLGVMRAVGLAACPSDAVDDVKRHAHYISRRRGGEGAARDVFELILKAQGRWNSLLKAFL